MHSWLPLFHRQLIPALWLLWAIYWIIASRNSKATRCEESVLSRIGHLLPLFLAIAMLWADTLPLPWLLQPLFLRSWTSFYSGAVIVAAGLAISVWARIYLAGNWSGTVTLKHDHELIQSGPYRLARHPIYTGLLLAFIGSALARDEVRGVLAVVIAGLALWRKLRLEEKWMVQEFGDVYRVYCRRTKALVPFLF